MLQAMAPRYQEGAGHLSPQPYARGCSGLETGRRRVGRKVRRFLKWRAGWRSRVGGADVEVYGSVPHGVWHRVAAAHDPRAGAACGPARCREMEPSGVLRAPRAEAAGGGSILPHLPSSLLGQGHLPCLLASRGWALRLRPPNGSCAGGSGLDSTDSGAGPRGCRSACEEGRAAARPPLALSLTCSEAEKT